MRVPLGIIPWVRDETCEMLPMLDALHMRERGGILPVRDREGWPLVLTLDERQVSEIRRLVRDDQADAVRERIRQLLEPMVESLLRLVSQNPKAAAEGLRVVLDLKAIPAGDKGSFTTAEVAERFRVSQQQVRRWCEQGRLDAERTPGGTWRILPPRGVRPLPLPGQRRKPVRAVAGKWKDRPDAMNRLREHLNDSRPMGESQSLKGRR